MVARRRFFATDDAAAPDRLQARDGLGTTMCLLAGGIPKEILRLLRRVTTDGYDWTARSLVDMSAREIRDGARMAVQRSALAAAQKDRLLEAMDRGDDGTSVERVALSAEPPVNDAPLLDLLRRLDRRRATIHALRARLDDLKVLEGELVAALAAGRPIDQMPTWVLDLHRTCVTVQTGMAPGGPTA
jgi:hypothetical protein